MQPHNRKRSKLRTQLRTLADAEGLDELDARDASTLPVYQQRRDVTRTAGGRRRRGSFPAHKRADLDRLRRHFGESA